VDDNIVESMEKPLGRITNMETMEAMTDALTMPDMAENAVVFL